MKRNRIPILIPLLLPIVAGLIVFMAIRVHHQAEVDHSLAEALDVYDVSGVRIALQKGANPNIDVYDAMYYGTNRIDYWSRGKKYPSFPALVCVLPTKLPATNSDTSLTQLLLDAGANPDCRVSDGQTPLMMAACRGDRNEVRVLLSHGAQVNMKDDQGNTSLYWARQPKQMNDRQKQEVVDLQKKEVVEMLRQAGAKE